MDRSSTGAVAVQIWVHLAMTAANPPPAPHPGATREAITSKREMTHEAIDLCEATLADRVRLLGPDHPDCLTSGEDLARALERSSIGSRCMF